MNRKYKITTLFFFFLCLSTILSTTTVKGLTTESVRVDCVFSDMIISDGVCYWSAGLGGSGKLICSYDESANYTFQVELLTPRNYGTRQGVVTTADLANMSLIYWDMDTN